MEQWTSVVAGVALVVVLGGCLAGAGVGQPQSPNSPAPTTGTPTASPAPATTNCANFVSFYGLDSPGKTGWAPDRIAIGYTVPANASVFFVAFEEGTVLGTTHVTTREVGYAVTADGDGIPLDEPLAGTHTVRVAAYADSNDNGQFDAGTDAPCRTDGTPVEAGPRRIDFSTFATTASPNSPDGTATPGSHESAQAQPDPDKDVRLVNEWNKSVTMTVDVVRESTGETVHEGTYELSPGAERAVYNTAEAAPDGVEAFTVVVTARGTTERITIETNRCYGDAYGTVREDGTVYVYYAIC